MDWNKILKVAEAQLITLGIAIVCLIIVFFAFGADSVTERRMVIVIWLICAIVQIYPVYHGLWTIRLK